MQGADKTAMSAVAAFEGRELAVFRQLPVTLQLRGAEERGSHLVRSPQNGSSSQSSGTPMPRRYISGRGVISSWSLLAQLL